LPGQNVHAPPDLQTPACPVRSHKPALARSGPKSMSAFLPLLNE
jgi:hypothetical protein